ncbi:helix-turn-helix transcriptional regulator [Pseudonocardia broussonetiae]|uniref:WYL domain-containing protein n=1 Tax=Pseudonocardia broussonetiae TaxID=2736640 RepID=A0A6M6JJV8_9PSEU|nr:WYL domain-containing protein [Pseudonocardia broussonetiae]QJY46892.1 WYL domain-containing protein [Pseudonocardia broussonetiae]
MRASRLVTLLFTLQRRRGATAAELARELEVSERTIYRDVAALADAGVPLFTETGPGGGIRLVDGWRTRLDGLTAQEAAALFAVGAPQVLAELGMSAALAGAQAKLLATLPDGLREHARTVAERFHLDAPGWFHTTQEVTQLAAVSDAVWADRRLRITYRRRDGEVERTVDPLGLVVKGGTWYLAARGGERILTYRVDRITGAEPTGEVFVRPEGFDLVKWWAESSAGFEATMLRTTVRLRLGPHGRRWLAHVTDTEAALRALDGAGPPDADGWCVVELAVEDVRVAAGQLVGLAGEVEALDPPELRAALYEAGSALAAHNQGDG